MDNELSITGQELEGRHVILKKEALKPEYHDITERVFLAEGGFGCGPNNIGRAVFGTYVKDGYECRQERYQIERFATDEEVLAAKAAGESS